MREIAKIVLAVVLSITLTADARKLPNWTHKSLSQASDAVVIATVSGDKVIDSPSAEFDKIDVVCHVTTFTVESSLKGEATDTVSVKHYRFNEKAFVVGAVNGPV